MKCAFLIARDGKMDISFRPLGMKLLAKELRDGKEAQWADRRADRPEDRREDRPADP